MSKRERPLKDDERVLWTTFTKAIAPLPGKMKRHEAIEPPPSHPPPPGKFVKVRPANGSPLTPPPKPHKSAPPPLAPLDRRAKQRVASGRTSIDGRLDLHGLTQAEAHDALARFIDNAVRREARMVLVITGKGKGGEMGVLRRQVPHWLSLPEFRDQVIGFEQAAIPHGGEGALYVRIRRQR